MSLTSILKSPQFKELKSKLREDFPRPKFDLSGELLAPPRSKNYGIVGTAFDYLLRFRLEYTYKQEIKHKGYWVADSAIDKIKESLVAKKTTSKDIEWEDDENTSKKDKDELVYVLNLMEKKRVDTQQNFYNTVRSLYKEAKVNYSNYIKTGILTDELVKSSIVLAKLDLYIRARILDKSISEFDNEDIIDLKQLWSIIPIEEFEPMKNLFLNPTFGLGSLIFMGADADLIIDNKLIDIKTVKNLKLDRADINQLLCYYVACRIGGINDDESLSGQIDKIGIYFSRFAKLWMIPLSEFGSNEKFAEFEKWIKEYLE
jgi:hypothetical protein